MRDVGTRVVAPRLSRAVIRLDDGHRVQVAVAGRGVPLVVVHGYTAEGFLYAQSLSRLVASGFRVVAIDTAGHGGTASLTDGGNLRGHAELLGRAVDHLGIRRAVFAGHSMGGRLVTELVARQPRRAIGVLLLDAIVGDTWDRMVQVYRIAPPLFCTTGTTLMADTMSTIPVLRNPRQAAKLARLWAPVWVHNARRPAGLVGAAVSIMRSGPSRWMLERLADERVPVVSIHGDRDLAVPLRTAKDAVRRSKGELVVVHGATHSWPLKDPETLPAIMCDLLESGRFGEAVAAVEDPERSCYAPRAKVFELTPPLDVDPADVPHARPRYRWTRIASECAVESARQ
jgi:pimeloyl-ACP methyl ester carboxylesterase